MGHQRHHCITLDTFVKRVRLAYRQPLWPRCAGVVPHLLCAASFVTSQTLCYNVAPMAKEDADLKRQRLNAVPRKS